MSYISFYIFAFLLNFIFAFAKYVPSAKFGHIASSSNYAPSARFGHIAVLADKKLYFHGGSNGVNHTNDFFYLDVSQDFSITDLPWNNLPFPGTPRNHQASACKGGKNDDLIFIFGGNVPEKSFSCVNFNNRSITIFAGDNHDKKNDLWIFDSFKLTWDISDAPNAPQDIIMGYSAITLPCETILYLGGKYTSNGGLAPMGILSLYDTVNNNWKILSTSGPTPPSLYYFSAVLTSDRRIIMFGGIGEDASSLGDLWILDSETYEWSAGNISNPNDLTIYSHTATLVDNYMIVAFGKNLVLTIANPITPLVISTSITTTIAMSTYHQQYIC
ncbi:hypothetical protein C2G38_2237991 [Gigaspora rosea]|uniref:Galactose oxidase n=1 Tax=Gigaspora rosea TaxID=44941 RepID=A0A397W9S5_9GLOM|nr:hypothetical protein C2G38_2237991 [Gigaspora rosea]